MAPADRVQLGFARTPIAVELVGAASFTQPKPAMTTATPQSSSRSRSCPMVSCAHRQSRPRHRRHHLRRGDPAGDPDLVDRRRGRLLAVIFVLVLNGGGEDRPPPLRPRRSRTRRCRSNRRAGSAMYSAARQGDRVLFTWSRPSAHSAATAMSGSARTPGKASDDRPATHHPGRRQGLPPSASDPRHRHLRLDPGVRLADPNPLS